MTFARIKSAKAFPFVNVAPCRTGGPKMGTSLLLDTATLYCVFSVQGFTARTMMNTCWNWERILRGLNGNAPGSWRSINCERPCIKLHKIRERHRLLDRSS